ncbi:MAG TPA: hypothetical protein V6D00_09575 [Pantanalinema sp.]
MRSVTAPTSPLPALEGPLPPPSRPPAAWAVEQLRGLGVTSALCLFSGWGAEARAFKRMGWSVTTLDPLASSVWWSRAFVAGGAQPLGDRRLAEWLKLRKEPEVVKRFLPWANRYFTPEETIWLGIWHQHLMASTLPDEERAIGVVAVYWAIRYWLSWNQQELGFKPLPPSAVFRHYVEQANRMREQCRGLPDGRHAAERLGPEPALSKYPGELLYCYVPPLEGIGSLGLAQLLSERWTQGDPALSAPLLMPGTLGGAFSDPAAHIAAVEGLIGAAEGFPAVALAYRGTLGAAIEAALAKRRPVLSRRELAIPYPLGNGERIVTEGLIVAGAARGRQEPGSAKGSIQ